MAKKFNIWLVEDELNFRDRFEELIGTDEAFSLDCSFGSYEALARHIKTAQRLELPDLIVMDIRLPGIDGIEATRKISEIFPELPILALTLKDDPDSVFAILEAGARGYIVKGATKADAVLSAMRDTIDGGTTFSPAVARHVLKQFASTAPLEEPLTVREQQVLKELANGGTKDSIAEILHLSSHTVDTHLRNIYKKLHAKNGPEAVAKGIRAGII